ncbi:MAG: zinc-binding alcohol dehydrogenase family protein [Kofleriaceae bacterium]
MLAAVLKSADSDPVVEAFAEPVLQPGEVVGTMLAAGLHPVTRGLAKNAHYSTQASYPLIPGVDGVAQLPDGRRVYTGWLRHPYGTFAESAAVNPMSLPIPDLDPALVAAMVNPAMSSWFALRLRAQLVAGETVLILGATGASGSLAVQVAKHLGAARVIAVGRSRDKLARLGVEAFTLEDSLAPVIAEVDIVLDYLWGEPAARVLAALAASKSQRRVRYVQIGGSAGKDFAFDSAALRAIDLAILGSGIGSVKPAQIGPEIAQLLPVLPALSLEIERVPLARVAEVWTHEGAHRPVITF